MAIPSQGAALIRVLAPALTISPKAARVPAKPRLSASPARSPWARRSASGRVRASPMVWAIQAGRRAKPQGLTGAIIPAAKARASRAVIGHRPW